jgi:hypothetical protein
MNFNKAKTKLIIAIGVLLYIGSLITKIILFPGDTFQAIQDQLQLVSWINLFGILGISVVISTSVITALRNCRKKAFTFKNLFPALLGISVAFVLLILSVLNLVVLSNVKSSNELISKKLQNNDFIKLKTKTEKNIAESEELMAKAIVSSKRSIYFWSILIVCNILIGFLTPVKQRAC